jgi:hypothetical protein
VSTRETVLAVLTVPEPESTWMVRPKPSNVVTFQRCGAPEGGLTNVAVCVFASGVKSLRARVGISRGCRAGISLEGSSKGESLCSIKTTLNCMPTRNSS